MKHIRKILFFADGARGEKAALGRAMTFARHCDAELTVLDVVAEVGSDDPRLNRSIKQLQLALIQDRRVVLEKLVADTLPENDPPHVDIMIHAADKDFIDVIHTVVTRNFDLLVKAADRTSAVSATLFGNHDLRLMRQCPAPVWIMKPGGRRKISTILAAVDATNESAEALALSKRIMNFAVTLAKIEGAELHALAAWNQPVHPHIRNRMDEEAYEALTERYKTEVRKRFDKLLADFSHADISGHVVRGRASKSITRYVDDYDVDLLIMGTLSRTGIPGLLIGNTAERVLNHVDCSVLTLKPEGFTTVIAPR